MEIGNEVTSTVYTLSVKIASRGTKCFAYDNNDLMIYEILNLEDYDKNILKELSINDPKKILVKQIGDDLYVCPPP